MGSSWDDGGYRSPLDAHFENTRQKVQDAKAQRADNHNAVVSALGAGSPDALAGPTAQAENEQEEITPAGTGSGRMQAWRETVKDFRLKPVDE